MMQWTAKWITPLRDMGDVAPVFSKCISISKPIKKADMRITAMGVYEANINDVRVGQFVMAPGWTDYHHRLQYQTYDVTNLLSNENVLKVTIGKGWYRSAMPFRPMKAQLELMEQPTGVLMQLDISYEDGTYECIITDSSWSVSEGPVRFSEIYDGEVYDANIGENETIPVVEFEGPGIPVVPQQGVDVIEQERLVAARIITTPKGECVVDFGQEITGYVEVIVTAKRGEKIKLSFAEVLDKHGNFYTENYRAAKCLYEYTCCDGTQTWHPKLTFYGFRYVRVDEFPGGIKNVDMNTFTAIAVYSDIKQTGFIYSSNPKLNQLISNIQWGQRGNFLDVPTDCPQRNERLGWTGDAQVFTRAACYNFDCEQFFAKWLTDMAISQREDGYIGQIIPNILTCGVSAAWEDAATICPWEIYLAYGNKRILEDQFNCMCKWVDYVTSITETPGLWTGMKPEQHGDWLGLDGEPGSREGASRKELIATAFYAHSTRLVVKVGHILEKDVTRFEKQYGEIVNAFRKEYPVYKTQTECIMAIHFELADNCQEVAKQLADMVQECGHLQTGFVGTPYLLHALSKYGHTELAYSLLLREEYPSWIYSVNKGATTIWEHWDGIMENGDFWDASMNSFNHYAYGAVIDWIYGVAGGITPVEEYPGYERVRIAPIPDARLDWLKVSLDTRHGQIRSGWVKQDTFWRYEISTPVPAEIVVDGISHEVQAGNYIFYSTLCTE